MKTIWLGQGGLLLISGKLKVIIDPYLSNSMREMDRSMKRRVAINANYLRIKPDMLILTNSHPDHADMKTIKRYLLKSRKRTVVLASGRAYDKIYSERIPGRHTSIMFEEGDEWTLEHLLIRGVKCKTDDKTAFGVVIEDSRSNKRIYVAGNTLYNKYLIQELPREVDVAYIPISGQYSTMNMVDAQRFAKELDAKIIVPFHYGMFDKVNPKNFDCPNKFIAKPYVPIPYDAESEETRKLPPEERLKLGLDEKPIKYPKNLRMAIKREKAEDKAYMMRKKLVDALQSMVECDDPTLTDGFDAVNIGADQSMPAAPVMTSEAQSDSFDMTSDNLVPINSEIAKALDEQNAI